MKITTLFTLLYLWVLSVGIAQAQAQAEDDAIKICINNYLEGITKGDTARLNRAFHPTAVLKTINSNSGKIQEFPVRNFIAKAPVGGLPATPRILNYSYAGISASAAVELAAAEYKYIDLLSMLKINGEWRIVARVFSRVEPDVQLTSPMMASTATTSKSGGAKTITPKPKPKPKTDDDWR